MNTSMTEHEAFIFIDQHWGMYIPNASWVLWDSNSREQQDMEKLVRQGLVLKEEISTGIYRYTLTDDGKYLLKHMILPKERDYETQF